MIESSQEFAALVELFSRGQVAVLTGAGISTDSGIPDYRGVGSLPRNPMNIAQFTEELPYRQRFWAGARVGFDRAGKVQPNTGHIVLAELERAGLIGGVITQNVDGLHLRAGSSKVVELHGSGEKIRCTSCGHSFSRAEVLNLFDELNPGFAEANAEAQIAPDGDAAIADSSAVLVPSCPNCGGVLRPSVVYFGETVPVSVFEEAAKLVDNAAALLVVGSSLAVNTGIRLTTRAERKQLPIAVINRGPTVIDGRASLAVRIEGGSSEVLSALGRALL